MVIRLIVEKRLTNRPRNAIVLHETKLALCVAEIVEDFCVLMQKNLLHQLQRKKTSCAHLINPSDLWFADVFVVHVQMKNTNNLKSFLTTTIPQIAFGVFVAWCLLPATPTTPITTTAPARNQTAPRM